MNKSFNLPKKVKVSLSELGIDEDVEIDDVDIDEVLCDYLSDTFGFCIFNFDFYFDKEAQDFVITDIHWDTSE